jgi:hypothetical protein
LRFGEMAGGFVCKPSGPLYGHSAAIRHLVNCRMALRRLSILRVLAPGLPVRVQRVPEVLSLGTLTRGAVALSRMAV